MNATKPKIAARRADPPAKSTASEKAVDDYRARMQLVGDLMKTSFAALASGDTEDDRIGRGAYLHIMGRVFEVLDGLSQAVPIDELGQLSKIVAEQRRAELNTRKVELENRQSRSGEHAAAPAGNLKSRKLPAGFGEVVRQVYGTSFADDVGEPRGED